MLYKPYGRTGIQLSAIGFGAMRFPQPEKLDEMAQIALHAHRKGINYFDTAPFYCDDKSEEIMGRAFAAMPRDSFYCSTKCAAAKGDELRTSLERSLKRLRVSSIDFFHIWCLLRPEQLGERTAGGAIQAALKAKAEGLIKHLVVSTHLSGEDIVKVLESGYFEGVTLGYNLLNFPFRQEGLAAALRLQLGVATMNPLGGGLIPRNAARLAFLKGPADRDVVEAALRFNVSDPAITLALVGFASVAEVDQAVAAVDQFTPHTVAHIESLKARINGSFNGFCTGCGYCLPCPSNVPIPKFMDAYNQKILNGTDKDITERLKWHWSLAPDEAAACTQCGQCEEACTQHLDIRERLSAIAALVGGR
jgi:predicted aldo/keto reductase-like oxidoreductase